MSERLAHQLGPLPAAIRSAEDAPDRIRVVDIGCGLGHVVRWLAAHDVRGPDVELASDPMPATIVALPEHGETVSALVTCPALTDGDRATAREGDRVHIRIRAVDLGTEPGTHRETVAMP
ncbi:hypothetical protein [Embleya scabrispora]|nr:hypothetical protein [Embleya scabrispora]